MEDEQLKDFKNYGVMIRIINFLELVLEYKERWINTTNTSDFLEKLKWYQDNTPVSGKDIVIYQDILVPCIFIIKDKYSDWKLEFAIDRGIKWTQT